MTKPLVWIAGEIKSPPFSPEGRQRAGLLLRALQEGHRLRMPASRPMPSIGNRVHELRVPDGEVTWRIVYRIDPDAILVIDVFAKKTERTNRTVIVRARQRIRRYDSAT